jgi:class 3 adenylate cyclase/tetratricopeptide (TPR) repeat protein
MLCRNCEYDNPKEALFCMKCGTRLVEGDTSAPRSLDSSVETRVTDRLAHEPERRQMTVLFCDLVGSTRLSEQLDPEDLREVMRTYQEACAKVIKRFEGHIAKYLGDGILVYFGYPKAHEDDVRRAVHVGLEVVEAVGDLPLQKKQLQQPLQVRVGIHTGLVVVGEMGAGEVREQMAIVGDTPNIAARLQGLAETDTVVISRATYRLIEGYFECESMGRHTLKGISQPMEAYKVVGESGLKSHLEVAAAKGLTPLVGRGEEVEILFDRWERAKEGEGQVVLLSGEAGIGKSRLLQVMKSRLEDEPYTKIETHCSLYHQNSSLYPVIDHLRNWLNFKRQDTTEEKLAKIEVALEKYGFSLEEKVPLFASLLSVPFSAHYMPLKLSPEGQKRKTFEALISFLLRESEKKPVLRIVEDLHWLDPSTLEYLSLLVDRLQDARVLIIFTFRPDFTLPWPIRSHITQIVLNRLDVKQIRIMVDRIAGDKPLPEEIVQNIAAKTDGIPLFIEELTTMILESGLLIEGEEMYKLLDPFPRLAIPSTLKDLLMARLDRLETPKDLVQVGATLGREFNHELLSAVLLLDGSSLKRELAKLVEAGILNQKDYPSQATYFFKHALIQEAAYESILKSKRQIYHRKVAEVLEEKFPETKENQPELLARHYTEAELSEEAIPLWLKAGKRATERSAHAEAINHLSRGLELLKSVSSTPKRLEQELNFQVALGAPLRVTEGFAGAGVENAYLRAMELCRQAGKTDQIYPVLRGMGGIYLARGELKKANELGKQLMIRSQEAKDSTHLLQAHYIIGASLFCLGQFESAIGHLEKGLSHYSPKEHSSHAGLYGQDPGTACLFWSSLCQWFLGYPDHALIKSDEAIKLAGELSHPYSLAITYILDAWIHLFRGDIRRTKEMSETCLSLCEEGGFGLFLPMGGIIHGWSLTFDEKTHAEGIERVRQGIYSFQEAGAELFCSHWYALLGDLYLKAGMSNEAGDAISQGFSFANKNSERYFEAELFRLRGELIMDSANKGENGADKHFKKAIQIARKQNATSLELRAVISYARLLSKQDKHKRAKKLLAEIYDRFTEGFDTRDLQAAKNLLEELA